MGQLFSSNKHKEAPIDLTIFDNKHIDDNCNNNNLSECNSILRLINGLIFYELCNEFDDNTSELFSKFLFYQYDHYLDDMIHFNTHHQGDLEPIYDKILSQHPYYKVCDIKTCIAANRHCSMYYEESLVDEKEKEQVSVLSEFHIKIWDAAHYKMNHLWETGLRERKMQNRIHSDDELNCIDDNLNERSKTMNKNRDELAELFDRFGSKHNKFTISAINKSPTSMTTAGSDTTMDLIYTTMVFQMMKC